MSNNIKYYLSFALAGWLSDIVLNTKYDEKEITDDFFIDPPCSLTLPVQLSFIIPNVT